MPRGKPEQAEQIIPQLGEVEVELGRGKTVAEAVKKIGVTEQTYYLWKKKFGGLRIDQAKRLKELEKENARLKRPRASTLRAPSCPEPTRPRLPADRQARRAGATHDLRGDAAAIQRLVLRQRHACELEHLGEDIGEVGQIRTHATGGDQRGAVHDERLANALLIASNSWSCFPWRENQSLWYLRHDFRAVARLMLQWVRSTAFSK
jgi:putative transposase